MSAAGDRNHLYIPPLVDPAYLTDVSIPLLFTEGEFKAIAMRRLASEGVPVPRLYRWR
jgi:hypothetical protein